MGVDGREREGGYMRGGGGHRGGCGWCIEKGVLEGVLLAG